MPSRTPHAARHLARRPVSRRVALARSVAVTTALALLLTLPGLVLAVDPTPTPTPAPTATPAATPTPAPTAAPTPTPTATAAPTPAPTPAPTASPAPTPSPTPSPTASPTPTPAPTGPTVLGATVNFHGRGYGHGVGMSQYGARGRALAGQSAAEILGHYYRGTDLGTLDPATPIRVRVLKSFAASATKPLVLYARRGPWRIIGVPGTFPKDARLAVTPRTATVDGVTRTTWKVKITDPAGTVLRNAVIGSFRITGLSDATVFQVWSRPSSYDTYRGVVRSVLDTRRPVANVVNEVALDTYLRGVVPAEMPSSWPTEALKAQSIAARSYAARRLRPGVSWYDVADDTTSQVYLGLEGERPATDAAIAATAGVVVRSGSAIANTMFHSAGGGATEHNENVYVSSSGARVAGPVSYLRGSLDRRPDGTAYDSASPYATWKTLTYTRSQLSAWFAADPRTNVGSLTALDLRRRGVSGRLVSVTLIGSLGSKTVSGDVFRSIFNARRPAGDPMLRSTLFDTKPVP